MNRWSCKTDDNQKEIVKALRAVGASVVSLAPLKGKCLDLLVGYRGHNLLMEVKDGNKPPSQQKLTDNEEEFLDNWRGYAVVVNSVEQALKVLLNIK